MMHPTIKVCCSGGFDPIRKGHLSYLREAKKLGDVLIVILNPDSDMVRKKGYCFQTYEERKDIISDLNYVDFVVKSIDEDGTVAKTLKLVKPQIYAKGGDRTPNNMAQNEVDTCNEIDCKIVYGVGEPRTDSSQDLVRRVLRTVMEFHTGMKPNTGHFLVAFDIDGTFSDIQGSVTTDQISKLSKSNIIWGILCSRSVENSAQVCNELGIVPYYIRQCEVDHRAPYLRQLANDYPTQFTVYVADRDIDKQEALRAGWEFYYPWEMETLIHRVSLLSI